MLATRSAQPLAVSVRLDEKYYVSCIVRDQIYTLPQTHTLTFDSEVRQEQAAKRVNEFRGVPVHPVATSKLNQIDNAMNVVQPTNECILS
jgi:hypothetical protein